MDCPDEGIIDHDCIPDGWPGVVKALTSENGTIGNRAACSWTVQSVRASSQHASQNTGTSRPSLLASIQSSECANGPWLCFQHQLDPGRFASVSWISIAFCQGSADPRTSVNKQGEPKRQHCSGQRLGKRTGAPEWRSSCVGTQTPYKLQNGDRLAKVTALGI